LRKKKSKSTPAGEKVKVRRSLPHPYLHVSIHKSQKEPPGNGKSPPPHPMKLSAGKVRERTALHYIDDVPCVPLAGFFSKKIKEAKCFLFFPSFPTRYFFPTISHE
jgi:hypothetical protein